MSLASDPMPSPRGFFLPVSGGQRLCLFHQPQGQVPRGRVLFLHPFAEELNASRRIVAQQARLLASQGFAVLQIDLLGCGDSSGDFADASWPAWLEDARQGHAWLSAHAGGPLWLWGLRAGALLASDLARELSEPSHLLLWQPVLSGQQMLQQFLRLYAAGQWLGRSGAGAKSPSQQLALGESVLVGGYTLTPAMANGLATARLEPPSTDGHVRRCVWLECQHDPQSELSPATTQRLSIWRDAHWTVDARIVKGPAFWQNIDLVEAPELQNTSLLAVTQPPSEKTSS